MRPLAHALRARNIEVWYDEFSLKLGDSIRQMIDRGLNQSRYGIIILSKAFFAKRWPQYELDGLINREIDGRNKVILPLWHGVDHDEVARYSPTLAGRKAMSSAEIDSAVAQIQAIVHPEGSPLIIARDLVLESGGTPPVVTDRRWLNAVEASYRQPVFDTAPARMNWGRWSFPLPKLSDDPKCWGNRIAWSYMQLEWTEAAAREMVTLLSSPDVVHQFIQRFPGLLAACSAYPELLIQWAPQLAIPGLEGPLLAVIKRGYRASCARARRRKVAPVERHDCDARWSLRHPYSCGFGVREIAIAYFGSDSQTPVSPYDDTDHIFWLLSSKSKWLPEHIRAGLTFGLSQVDTWLWRRYDPRGVVAELVLRAIQHGVPSKTRFEWSRAALRDLRLRAKESRSILDLPESANQLADSFINEDIVDHYITYVRSWRYPWEA